MKAFDPNYKLLDEMYQDDYYPVFLVDKVKDELQKVIDLLESGETDTEVVQETLDEAVCGINDLQEMCIRDSSEIVNAHEDCPELQAVLDEYHKPVVIQDQVLGELTLDKDYDLSLIHI